MALDARFFGAFLRENRSIFGAFLREISLKTRLKFA
jgi:hypothetical protein